MSSFIAMRGENQVVSLIKLEPIHSLDVNLKSSRGEGSSISWSYDGRFLARSNGTEVLISDAKRSFADVARIKQTDIVRCVRFCHAEGSHDRLAIIDSSGILRFAKVRISVGNVFLQDQSSVLLPEKNLSAMAWSTGMNLNSFFPRKGPFEIFLIFYYRPFTKIRSFIPFYLQSKMGVSLLQVARVRCCT